VGWKQGGVWKKQEDGDKFTTRNFIAITIAGGEARQTPNYIRKTWREGITSGI
jgi:hypothetical protein